MTMGLECLVGGKTDQQAKPVATQLAQSTALMRTRDFSRVFQCMCVCYFSEGENWRNNHGTSLCQHFPFKDFGKHIK